MTSPRSSKLIAGGREIWVVGPGRLKPAGHDRVLLPHVDAGWLPIDRANLRPVQSAAGRAAHAGEQLRVRETEPQKSPAAAENQKSCEARGDGRRRVPGRSEVHQRKKSLERCAVAGRRRATALQELHFDGDQSPVTKQLLDQCLRRADPRDTVPGEDDPALAVELHLLQPHHLLDAAHQFLRVLQRNRLRQGNRDRDNRLGLGPLLYRVLDHQEAPFPDRHHERRSRGLQGAQRFPVVGVVQPEAQCGARLIVGVKNSVQAIGPGDLGEQPLRVALQIQVPPVRGGLQLLRRLRLARRGERFARRHTGRGWRFRAGYVCLAG